MKKIIYYLKNRFSNQKTRVTYLVENADWVIRHDGISITSAIRNGGYCTSRISVTASGIRGQIVHFGSIHLLQSGIDRLNASNYAVGTWYHVVPEQDMSWLKMVRDRVVMWHTASSTTQKQLLALGISAEKLAVIPIGVDLSLFKPLCAEKKTQIKRRLNIPDDAVIIGSFQKDGVGWGEGLEPKYIKGPDIFCEAVHMLSKSHKIHVLLTGPARGYVKDRLKKSGIPYTHCYLAKYRNIADYYAVLDIYLVASRIEGGPKSIMESMASGVPVVSTDVGMAPDIITAGRNGFIVNIEDPEAIAAQASRLIGDDSIRKRCIENGLETVKAYGWDTIARQYYEKIYKRILDDKKSR